MPHRLICVDCLVTMGEIAQRLEVSLSTVDNWIQGIRGKGYAPFPEPVKSVGRTRIWDWSEVAEWHENYQPQRGGAPRGDRNGKRTQRPLTIKTERGWRNAG